MGAFWSENDIEAMFQSLKEDKGPRVAPVRFQRLQPPEVQSARGKDISFLGDVELTVDVELGSTEMTVKEVLELSRDDIVLLDCLAGEPVKIDVNGVLFGKGEVVVINEYFGVRVTELANEEAKEEGRES
ncbi:MAG TPA: hypothetical protein GXX34_11350 [Clostridia bacterium]|nr:hypothetical protein [Clostridia bacterium]